MSARIQRKIEGVYSKLAESATGVEEGQFREMLEGLPTGAYTCDAAELITYFNQHAVKAWGRVPRLNDEEDRFCGSFRLYTGEGEPLRHEQCWMARALRSGQGYNGEEVIVERPDGKHLTVLAYANPIRNKAGQVVGAVTVLVISKRKSDEAELRRSRDKAEALNRAKDIFLAVLSHELRVPLSPVGMTVAAMENDPELPEKFREGMAMMRRNIDLEVKLIDDLLDVSRAIHGKLRLQMQEVRIHDVLRFVIKNCMSEIQGKGLTVGTDFGATHDLTKGDPARIEQVFWNILRNASKFSLEGGEIFIRTWNAGEQVCVEVQDGGAGIAAEDLPRIFEAFKQGEARVARQYGGLGLGLSIVKAVIDLHHGTVSARSEGKGRGATFTVCLRTATVEGGKQKSGPPTTEGAGRRGSRILLVEDHVDTATTMARLMKMAGHEVEVAHSVAEALRLAAAMSFDVMVSDIGLPDATGYDLMAQIRDQYCIKGIAVSGYGTEEDVQRSREAGFDEHVVKPVNVPQLEAIIQRLVGGGAF